MIKKTILLVSNNVNLLELLSRKFTEQGYKVEKATTGKKAFSLLKTNFFSIVVSSYELEDGQGISLSKLAKKIKPKPRFYFYSFRADKISFDCIRVGTPNFFIKPTQIDEVVDFIINDV